MFNIVGEAATLEEASTTGAWDKGDKGSEEADKESVGFDWYSTDSHAGALLRDLNSCWAVGWELVNLYPTGEKLDEVTGKMVQTYELMLRRPKS
jgi:hypothetical protein